VQLVSALTAEGQRWLGTERVDKKSNEIPAVPKLLDRLELRGKLVALDALHTQTHTARHIVQARGGDYLCTLEDNQPTLRLTVETLLTPQPFSPSPHAAEHRPHREKNKSRHESRRARTVPVSPEQVGFPAAAQALELTRRIVEKGKRRASPPLLLLTSAAPEDWNARSLLRARRDYWGIESTFHQRLGVTLDEDRSRVRTPNAAHALDLFRRLVVSVAHGWIQRAQKKNWRAKIRCCRRKERQ